MYLVQGLFTDLLESPRSEGTFDRPGSKWSPIVE